MMLAPQHVEGGGADKAGVIARSLRRSNPVQQHRLGIASPPKADRNDNTADKTSDARTDLYSLGVVWYQCATLINPYFVKGNSAATMQKHFGPLPPAPSELNPDLPKYWDGIILKLLAQNPADRFELVQESLRDLGNRLRFQKQWQAPSSLNF